MKAFILAAGLGSRLAPLTNHKPKALVAVNGKPMLQNLIERLKSQGFDELLINVHHFGGLVVDFLKAHDNFGVNVAISDERNGLLDTGGAIVKAGWFFKGEEPVLVHNVDVYSDMDFVKLIHQHSKSKALVTLVTRSRISSRKLLFDSKNRLIGWKHLQKNETKWVGKPVTYVLERAYSGIYVASPLYPDLIRQKGSFSIIPEWLDMAARASIMGIEHNDGLWFDLGSVDKINDAESKMNT
ncbi:MAG: nucleotidyltransferase family protein [Bacteroidetes bacterium]|nr:MAG: nucleotidyltransferase family protein [Bacteroidota bacterium]